MVSCDVSWKGTIIMVPYNVGWKGTIMVSYDVS